MNDCRCSESGAGLPLTCCDWGVDNQGDDDELQADQSAGGRPDDHVKIFPSGERCHPARRPLSNYASPWFCSPLTITCFEFRLNLITRFAATVPANPFGENIG